MAAKTKTKRMSHANCSHPKTSNERAKCRSRRNSENLMHAAAKPRVYNRKAVPSKSSGESVQELAQMLSKSLGSLRFAEKRVEEHQANVQLIQETLTQAMLDKEPRATVDGLPPVVAFQKRFRSNAKAYSYAALGVAEPRDNHRLEIQGVVHSVDYVTVWYLSCGSGRAAAPKTWQELIEFMGIDGLETLEVLRGS